MARFTRRTRSLTSLLAMLATLACACAALASEGDEPDARAADTAPAADSAAPELIKLYDSQALGQLRLPGLWQVTDVADGVRAVEPDQQRPAAIEIGTVRLPAAVPAQDLAEAVATELGRALGQAEVVLRQPAPGVVGDDDDGDAFYLEIDAREHDTDVRYAVLAVTGRKAAIIASLGAPAERFDTLVPATLLQDIVLSIE